MAYYTTAIQSATMAKDFMDWLSPKMTTNGWTLDDTYTNGNVTAMVFKSPAASNDPGSDFFVNVVRSSDSATTVGFGVAEAYNSATNVFTKYAPASGAGISVNIADNTVTDAVGVAPDSATLKTVTIPMSVSVEYTFHAVVDVNTLIVGDETTGSGFVYVGVADSFLLPDDDPVCLVVTGLYVSGTAGDTDGGGSTREPGAPDPGAGNFQVAGGGGSANGSDFLYAYAPNTATGPLPSTDDYMPFASAPIFVASLRGAVISPRALLRGVCTTRWGSQTSDVLAVPQRDGVTSLDYVMVSSQDTNKMKVFVPAQ